MSEPVFVCEANGRAIFYTPAVFMGGFNVYKPDDAAQAFVKENDRWSFFRTREAAEAWANEQPPLRAPATTGEMWRDE